MKLFKFGSSTKSVIWSRLSKKLEESGKLPAKQSFFDYEEHFEDYELNETFVKSVPVVAAAIDKTVDFVVSSGYFVVSDVAESSKIISKFMRLHDFDNFLRKIVRDLLMYGNCYVEILLGDDGISDLKIWSPKYFHVLRDQGANVIGYAQVFPDNSRNNFAPETIIHFKYNVTGNDAYGTSLVHPISTSLTRLLKMQKEMQEQADLKPKLQIKMGSDQFPASQGDIDAVAEDAALKNKDEAWITNHRMDFNVVGFSQALINVEPFAEHFMNDVLLGLEVPIFLLGSPEGSNRSTAEEQLVAFQRRIKSIQYSIENPLETKLFSLVLSYENLDSEVEFEWGMDEIEKKEVLRVMTLLLRDKILVTDAVRMAINKKLSRALNLGLDENVLNSMSFPSGEEEVDDTKKA